MKKFVSVIVVGLLLLVAVPVMAATNSLIGQKVQGVFSIEKGGKKVADAVIINGVAYAPVRSVADATGAKLTVEGKKIVMSDGTAATASSTPVTLEKLKSDRQEITNQISTLTAGIKDLEENVLPGFRENAEINKNNKGVAETTQAALDLYENMLSQKKAELADLQKQLDSIDAQIAELQK
ncbi:hypothetical protein KIH86_13830 [Paenibacillus sp. HN-1]|uniref:hypothetical protein n=1 Tax=Paenibacillus TaxID=44249 RepID=UPI001CA892BA|nr:MULTISPECIES: hypothetical protein [Paenibacillus]MBY9082389.1 hypothetical protein [Paenibacillus sp. CGMCC 1.18879]MBY9085307.1 hypothetical protein [Paenibacillus sinensis]